MRISAGADDCAQLCWGEELQQGMKAILQSEDVLSGPRCFCFTCFSVLHNLFLKTTNVCNESNIEKLD